MIVLDTNVVSEPMRRRPSEVVVAWLDAQPDTELFVTAVTAAELLYGVARLDDGSRKRRLGGLIDAVLHEDFADRILPFDVDAAGQYASLVTQRERVGRPIGMADAQIAAICRLHDATLATRNVDDFTATGLTLVDPFQP